MKNERKGREATSLMFEEGEEQRDFEKGGSVGAD